MTKGGSEIDVPRWAEASRLRRVEVRRVEEEG